MQLMFFAKLRRPAGVGTLGGVVALCMAAWALPANSAAVCDGAQNVRLLRPVEVSAEQRARFQAMPPLKVVAVSAPPMARYDEDRQTYSGIGIDVFCFITRELGLSFELRPDRDETVADKIRRVQEGRADVFIPLSHSAQREQRGLFTLPYYESHYAVIARHGRRVFIRGLEDLANYRVGIVQGVSFQPLVQKIVPAERIHMFNETTSDALFQAVRDGTIDVAVFNKNIFIEKRYRQEFFDLDIIHTLHELPRAYRYYFSRSPGHESLVRVFDRYLAAIDVSASIMEHEEGERYFFERYIAQRDQRVLLQAASVAAVMLALLSGLALLRYRRLTKLLAERNTHIQRQQEALQEAYKKLQTLSRTDGLTWLSNRRHFDQMLAHEYARYQRTGEPLSLLIVDVDHFKNVNDQYGHAVGDDYLRAVADVLRNSVTRSTDQVARYGGEEFTCLLPDTGAEDARAIAERIHRGVAALDLPNASVEPPRLTASIGVATIIHGDPGAQALVAQADAQLYAAKQSGRNRICATVIG